ncbi:MAG: hypothetical protein A2V66_14935 [Ignavibacteria bacterium RBG_13_36_8]|nr:MAG: hypothetical protein A2V66_14935 [Ignavibacteria bacterium RBG_13_36_8]
MNTHILSKSSFLKGIQCEKHLYLYKYHPELQDQLTELQKAVFNRGHEVGKLARELFPNGIDASPKTHFDYSGALKLTDKLITDKENVIYEAAFQSDDVLVASDIVVRDGEKWKIYEVKSSTSISEVYLLDAAVQYYVISKCGIEISDFSIIYINNGYVRKSELELDRFLKIESVLELIQKEQADIENEIQRLKKVLAGKKIPEIDIGEYCTHPYTCSFFGTCWKHVPENSVFEISGMHLFKKFELYNAGIIKIDDVSDKMPLSRNQRLQVDTFKSGKTVINKGAIKEFSNTLSYPMYFLDFESFQPAVPLYDNSSPYQQIPFQYSLYFQETAGGELRHFEYLAEAGVDPRIGFINSLLKDIDEQGDIIVYNQAYEIARLKELARDFPEYSERLETVILRIKDIMIPFQKKYYYSPMMKGSYSIKNVLPALISELDYTNLSITDGVTASLAFEKLQRETDMFRVNEIRNQLLEYCKLDTLAMVRIYQKFKEVIDYS